MTLTTLRLASGAGDSADDFDTLDLDDGNECSMAELLIPEDAASGENVTCSRTEREQQVGDARHGSRAAVVMVRDVDINSCWECGYSECQNGTWVPPRVNCGCPNAYPPQVEDGYRYLSGSSICNDTETVAAVDLIGGEITITVVPALSNCTYYNYNYSQPPGKNVLDYLCGQATCASNGSWVFSSDGAPWDGVCSLPPCAPASIPVSSLSGTSNLTCGDDVYDLGSVVSVPTGKNCSVVSPHHQCLPELFECAESGWDLHSPFSSCAGMDTVDVDTICNFIVIGESPARNYSCDPATCTVTGWAEAITCPTGCDISSLEKPEEASVLPNSSCSELDVVDFDVVCHFGVRSGTTDNSYSCNPVKCTVTGWEAELVCPDPDGAAAGDEDSGGVPLWVVFAAIGGVVVLAGFAVVAALKWQKRVAYENSNSLAHAVGSAQANNGNNMLFGDEEFEATYSTLNDSKIVSL
ncbi:hypothetical protein DIPPA_30163 [Diplonema papillatum]|nr:hypothetical protein DIPPA_30163 [Diplonema papillatum]